MKTLITVLTLTLAFNTHAIDTSKKPADKKEAAAPVIRPVVKKPCKPEQTAEKDNCHEVKKLK